MISVLDVYYIQYEMETNPNQTSCQKERESDFFFCNIENEKLSGCSSEILKVTIRLLSGK